MEGNESRTESVHTYHSRPQDDRAIVYAATDNLQARGEPITIENLERELTRLGRPGAPLPWVLRLARERGAT